jgi:hypothetical protein
LQVRKGGLPPLSSHQAQLPIQQFILFSLGWIVGSEKLSGDVA